MTILNLKCKKCKSVFDSDVGDIGFPEDSDFPKFEHGVSCPKCGKKDLKQIEMTELGELQMSEAYYKKNPPPEPDEGHECGDGCCHHVDHEFEEVMRNMYKWGLDFSKSKSFEALTKAEKGAAEAVIMSFTEVMYTHNKVKPEAWSEKVITKCCLHQLPEEISLENDYFKAISPVLTSFFSYLEESGKLKGAKKFSALVKGLDKDIVKNASKPAKWGPAKQFMMAAKSAGVDLNDKEAMNEFFLVYSMVQQAAKDGVDIEDREAVKKYIIEHVQAQEGHTEHEQKPKHAKKGNAKTKRAKKK